MHDEYLLQHRQVPDLHVPIFELFDDDDGDEDDTSQTPTYIM